MPKKGSRRKVPRKPPENARKVSARVLVPKTIVFPKKVRSEKSCALCQKHGGAHTTHNTGECRKYEKDGTLKKSFNGKAAVGAKYNGKGKKDHANYFAQIMECFSKLKKAVKKTQKSSRKKKRCQEYSDSSDSDSE
jgi:hypothetical protein